MRLKEPDDKLKHLPLTNEQRWDLEDYISALEDNAFQNGYEEAMLTLKNSLLKFIDEEIK